jgi:hypothetical protein
MKQTERPKVLPKKIITLLSIILIITICAAVFVKSIFIKDTYVTAELLVSGGEWWWDTTHPPYWLGDPIVIGAAEYTLQGKKQIEIVDVQKFNEGNKKTIYLKAKMLVTENKWTKKYRYKQTPFEIGATVLLSPSNTQLYANVIGIEGVSPDRKRMKRNVTLRWYNVFPWQADAISIGDQMKSSDGFVWATILSKDVISAQRIILNANPIQPVSNVELITTDPFKRDVTMTAEIQTTLATNSEVFAYYMPVKIGDIIIVNLSRIIINPFIIDIN